MNSSDMYECLLKNNLKPIHKALKEDISSATALLSAVLMYSEKTWAKYQKMGIERKVFDDTMEDIDIWVGNFRRQTGCLGVSEIDWLKNHLYLKLFSLGRLQFMPYIYPQNDEFFTRGTNFLDVHVPQGKPLDFDECSESFSRAIPFFAKLNKDVEYTGFICRSWLLSPVLKEFLDEKSNIIRFQNRFSIIGFDENDRQAEERLFQPKFGVKTESSLYKNAEKYVKNGGKIGVAVGVIKI